MSLLPKGIEGNTVWVLPGTVPHHETERLVAGSLETVSGGFRVVKDPRAETAMGISAWAENPTVNSVEPKGSREQGKSAVAAVRR
jgi:hypothetical protein